MTWVCHACQWRYPDDVPSLPAFYDGKPRRICGMCLNVNPNRLTEQAARDFDRALMTSRAARLSGQAEPPPTAEPEH